MKRVSFSKPIELFTGIIGLTDAQANVRAHSLKPVGKGIYEIVGKVEFKAGEPIAFKSIPKALITLLPKKLEPSVAKKPETNKEEKSGNDAKD